jgi:hypothetical protein
VDENVLCGAYTHTHTHTHNLVVSVRTYGFQYCISLVNARQVLMWLTLHHNFNSRPLFCIRFRNLGYILLQIEITVTKFYFAFPKRGIQSHRPARKIDFVVSYVLKNTIPYKWRDSKEPRIIIKLQLLQTSVRTPLNLGKGFFLRNNIAIEIKM